MEREPDAVGRRLERAREARGLTQAALARRAQVAPSTLSKVVLGHRAGADLSLRVATRLCVALGVTLDWFAGRWLDEAVPYPPEAEWLLATPGGLDQLLADVVREVLARRGAQPPGTITSETEREHEDAQLGLEP